MSVIICIWVFNIETTFCLIVAHIGHFDSIDKILKHIRLYENDDSNQNHKNIKSSGYKINYSDNIALLNFGTQHFAP